VAKRVSRHRNADTHHWLGEAPDLTNYFGFVYMIECISTGKKYIGKKQYYFAKRGSPKSRVANVKSPKWNIDHWSESDWKIYAGSSRVLKEYIEERGKGDFTCTILTQCESRGALQYAEIKEQIDRGVLLERDGEGDYVYFNRQIAAIKFRPPAFFSSETRKKISKNHRCLTLDVHVFYKITGEAFIGTRSDFARHTEMNSGNITALIKGEVYDKNFEKSYPALCRQGWYYGGGKPDGVKNL